jgi:hypothetical protein
VFARGAPHHANQHTHSDAMACLMSAIFGPINRRSKAAHEAERTCPSFPAVASGANHGARFMGRRRSRVAAAMSQAKRLRCDFLFSLMLANLVTLML